MVEILKTCSKELDEWSEETLGELADALARLERGHILSMPLSRPMPSIGSGVHELRFRDRSGIYRVIYWIQQAGRIWLIHAFKKKTQATPKQNLEVAKDRIRRIIK